MVRLNKPRVKICGITRAEDAYAAINAGAHALGFIFHKPSPRYITPEKASSIIKALPLFVTTVGVFVNRCRTEIERIIAISGIKAVQFHGEETPDDCKSYSLPVIKAFRIVTGKQPPNLRAYPVAGLLVEPQISGHWGGTGIPLDWAQLKKDLDPQRSIVQNRLVLAGGLNPQNVALAATILQPYAVDVSSGVEDEPGVKNHKKIEEFINALYG